MVGFGMVCGSEIDGIQIVFPWNVRRRLETGKGFCARLFKPQSLAKLGASAAVDPTDEWMARLEAGDSGAEACGVLSEVREGLEDRKSWACALVRLGLKKPLLRPASSAEFSSSSWMGSRELLGRVHRLYCWTTGFALGNPLIDKEPPPAQPASRDADARHFIPGMRAHADRNGQQVTDGRANAPGLRIIGQIQQLEGDQKVVGQHRQGIERLVGDQVLAGRMVQIQPAEHFAKALFLGSLEPVPLKDALRAARVCRF